MGRSRGGVLGWVHPFHLESVLMSIDNIRINPWVRYHLRTYEKAWYKEAIEWKKYHKNLACWSTVHTHRNDYLVQHNDVLCTQMLILGWFQSENNFNTSRKCISHFQYKTQPCSFLVFSRWWMLGRRPWWWLVTCLPESGWHVTCLVCSIPTLSHQLPKTKWCFHQKFASLMLESII